MADVAGGRAAPRAAGAAPFVMDGTEVRPDTIWMFRQNRPTLIARDLQRFGVPADATYAVLLARGVFKWLSVRRDLIRLKDGWKIRVRQALAGIRGAKAARNRDALMWYRGYLAALQECRSEVRALCHSPRWRAPDNDPEAVRWLAAMGRGEMGGT